MADVVMNRRWRQVNLSVEDHCRSKRGFNEKEQKKRVIIIPQQRVCVSATPPIRHLFIWFSIFSVCKCVHTQLPHFLIYLPPMPLLLLLPFSLSLAPPQMHSAIRGRYKTPWFLHLKASRHLTPIAGFGGSFSLSLSLQHFHNQLLFSVKIRLK